MMWWVPDGATTPIRLDDHVQDHIDVSGGGLPGWVARARIGDDVFIDCYWSIFTMYWPQIFACWLYGRDEP